MWRYPSGDASHAMAQAPPGWGSTSPRAAPPHSHMAGTLRNCSRTRGGGAEIVVHASATRLIAPPDPATVYGGTRAMVTGQGFGAHAARRIGKSIPLSLPS